MDEIIQAIKNERVRQLDLWGNDFDDKHTIADWSAFINRYLSRASEDNTLWKETRIFNVTEIRTNLIKAGAIVVAAIEALDRNGENFAKRHYEK